MLYLLSVLPLCITTASVSQPNKLNGASTCEKSDTTSLLQTRPIVFKEVEDDTETCSKVTLDPPLFARKMSTSWDAAHQDSMLTSTRAWCSRPARNKEWLQLDLGKSHAVIGVITKGRNDWYQWVTKYKLLTSEDETNWVDKGIFVGNSDKDTPKVNTISKQMARYVKFVVEGFRQHPSMRAAVIACLADVGCPVKTENTGELKRHYTSIYNNDHYGIGHARSMLDSPQAWSAAVNENQWMQIDLGEIRTVVGVVTQGRPQYAQWVKKYTVKTSATLSEAAPWKSTDFRGNGDRNSKVINYLPHRVLARYVRFYPKEWQSHVSMRAAVIVCEGVGAVCPSLTQNDCKIGHGCHWTGGDTCRSLCGKNTKWDVQQGSCAVDYTGDSCFADCGDFKKPSEKPTCEDIADWDSSNFSKCDFWGDPHYGPSFNNPNRFDFQGIGVYKLASTNDGKFEVQAMQCQWMGTAASVAVGFVIKMEGKLVFIAHHEVTVDGSPTNGVAEGIGIVGTISQRVMTKDTCARFHSQVREYKGVYYHDMNIRIKQSLVASEGVCGTSSPWDVVPAGEILFSDAQILQLCSRCSSGTKPSICKDDGKDGKIDEPSDPVDVTDPAVVAAGLCKAASIALTDARTKCACADKFDGIDACVVEYCASAGDNNAIQFACQDHHTLD